MTTTLSQSIQPQVRTIDGLSIRYAESMRRDEHALLLSPWPESICCSEPTRTRLAEHTHLVAIYLPRFGQSERRDSLMSPGAIGESGVRVADAFGLEQPHVVGPDVGTAASPFAAALYPGRFRSLVVGTGGTTVPLQLGNPVNAEYLHERLPKSKLDIIDAGHFIWEDAAEQYATLVTSWWARGYATAGSS